MLVAGLVMVARTLAHPLDTFLLFPTGSIILFIELSVFSIPRVSEFVTAVYAVILSLAKAAWFLSPVAGLNRAQVFPPPKVAKSSTRGYETVR